MIAGVYFYPPRFSIIFSRGERGEITFLYFNDLRELSTFLRHLRSSSYNFRTLKTISPLNSFCLSIAFTFPSFFPLPGAGSSPGLSPWDQPQGVTPVATRQTDKTIIGRRHDQPDRSDVAAPQNAEGQGLSGSRQADTRERRPNAPTASMISAFPGTSAAGTLRRNPHQSLIRRNNNAPGNRRRSSRRQRYQLRQRNQVAATVRHRLQSPGTARQALETSPTSGTDSTPATTKGSFPGAALPPCRRPQRCSQSQGRPPPGAGLSPGLSPRDQPQGVTPAATRGNRQDDHRQSPRSARPQRRSGTPKRRRTSPQQIKAGKDKGTSAERAHRLDFGLSRYVRRDYPRDGMRPDAGGRHHDNLRNNARGTRRQRQFRPGQRNPVSGAVTGNRPASPGDIANQRHGLNPGHGERHSPRRCSATLSPTAALQSTPGTSAARRRINRRASPRQQPAGTDKTIVGRRHDYPVRSDAAEPQNAEGQGLRGSKQTETRERRPNTPTASMISAFPGTPAAGTLRRNPHQSLIRRNNNAPGNRRRSSRRQRYQLRQRNQVAATVRHRLQSPGTARQAPETSPTSGTDSTPVTMKDTLPGAALPLCHRPQHCSQSQGTSATRRRIKPWTQPAGSTAGRHPGSNPREPTRRSSDVATITPSAATQRNPKTPKDKASEDQSRQRQGKDGRTRLPPRFRPFPVRPPRLSANKKGRTPHPKKSLFLRSTAVNAAGKKL